MNQTTPKRGAKMYTELRGPWVDISTSLVTQLEKCIVVLVGHFSFSIGRCKGEPPGVILSITARRIWGVSTHRRPGARHCESVGTQDKA